MADETKPTEAQAAKLSTIDAPPLWRLQLVNALQLIGVLIAITGSAEFLNLINVLSPEVAAWLTVSGSAVRFGAEPLVKLVGDYVDDGKRNDSFRLDP